MLVVDIHLPPAIRPGGGPERKWMPPDGGEGAVGGGNRCEDAAHDGYHQHVMDYGFVFLDAAEQKQTRFDFYFFGGSDYQYKPWPNLTKTGCDGSVGYWGLRACQAEAAYHSITPGETTGHALHQLANARTDAWLRCYQVELK